MFHRKRALIRDAWLRAVCPRREACVCARCGLTLCDFAERPRKAQTAVFSTCFQSHIPSSPPFLPKFHTTTKRLGYLSLPGVLRMITRETAVTVPRFVPLLTQVPRRAEEVYGATHPCDVPHHRVQSFLCVCEVSTNKAFGSPPCLATLGVMQENACGGTDSRGLRGLSRSFVPGRP